MNTLITRVISAVIAVIVMALLYYFFDVDGLKFACFVTPILGVRELIRILFKPTDSILIKSFFIFFVILVFAITVRFFEYSVVGFAFISILFCCISIIFENKFEDLAALSMFQAKGILGLFYVGLLPALAERILTLPNGKVWFLLMLTIVFAGDTFAYIFGILWGNKKILPNISPKKTVVGSFGGLLGSAMAGLIGGIYFLPHISLFGIVLVALFTGLVAQLGDLFESMLKRVANRKDSGTLMPGHGGILDRLDGVLFGAPILLAGALLLENLV